MYATNIVEFLTSTMIRLVKRLKKFLPLTPKIQFEPGGDLLLDQESRSSLAKHAVRFLLEGFGVTVTKNIVC